MKSFPYKAEQLEFEGTKYLRVPYVQRGFCEGCVANDEDRRMCDWIEVAHKSSCIMSILILDTPEAKDTYVSQQVAARLEGEEWPALGIE